MKVFLLLVTALCLTATAQTTDKEWQAKAIEKYPGLGVQGSIFNKRFVDAYTERQKANPAFFKNPQWPLLLADELAGASSTAAPRISPTPHAPQATPVLPVTQRTPATDASPPQPQLPPGSPARAASHTESPSIGVAGFIVIALACLAGIGVFVSLVKVVKSLSARSQARSPVASASVSGSSEQTLWTGHPSQWHFFWRWVLGLLFLPLFGVGLIFFFSIFWDRARLRYIVTNRRVILGSGIFVKSTTEIRIKDIRSINVSKSGIAGFMGVGNVEFASAAADRAEVVFRNTAVPDGLRDMVRHLQEGT